MKLSPAVALSFLVLLGACRSSPAVRSAQQGENEQARQALAQEHVDLERARELATAALAHDIAGAENHDGRAFVQGLSACAVALERPLRKRSRGRDPVAAEAALLLVEHDLYRGKKLSTYRSDPDGAWRALAARATEKDHAQRIAFFVDDDERVRRAALSASLEVADERDVPALLEASRVDPDGVIRSRSIQTLGRIGGSRVFTALLDRFSASDEPIRLAIVDAFASSKLAPAGGLEQLRKIALSEPSFPGLHAASLLARREAEDRSLGLSRLTHFARHGTTQERRMALRVLPGAAPETDSLLLEATRATDAASALIAWARLLTSPGHADSAEKTLLDQARQEGELSYQAKAALAAAGTVGARELFLGDVSAKQPEIRVVAGFGLLRLQAYQSLAPLLADDDREVRSAVGCRLLAQTN